MGIGAHHSAAHHAHSPETFARRIACIEERLGPCLPVHGRIVKLVALDLACERQMRSMAERSIAEMELASRETCSNRQESGHLMAHALAVRQMLAEHHEATAFTIDERAAPCRVAQALEKAPI